MKKKKRVRKLISYLLLIALIFPNYSTAWAQDEPEQQETQVTQEAQEQQSESAEEETKEESSQEEGQYQGIMPLLNGGGFGVNNVTSQIGGVNFVNAPANSSQLALDVVTPITGGINVKFPAATTDGRVEITLPKGVAWNYMGDTNGLGTIGPRTGITMGYGTIDMSDGTVAYDVNANVTDFSISNIKVNQMPQYAGRVLPSSSRIEIKVYYGGTLQDTVYINNIKLSSMGTSGSWIAAARDLFTTLDDSILQATQETPGVSVKESRGQPKSGALT